MFTTEAHDVDHDQQLDRNRDASFRLHCRLPAAADAGTGRPPHARRVRTPLQLASPDNDGVFRSEVFPGLWLDGPALLAGDVARVLAVLQQGLATADHAAFVERMRTASAAE
jgi:hypothetical protein